MKRFFVMMATVITMLVGANNINAQTPDGDNTQNVEYSKENKTFKKVKKSNNNDQETSYLWEDSKGNTYTIWLHKYTRGENAGKTTCFVWRVSKKTGKEYKYYLPNGIEIAEQILRENQ